MTAMAETLELPRPAQLARTTGWNLAESFGLPLGAYALTVTGTAGGVTAHTSTRLTVTAAPHKSFTIAGTVMISPERS